MLNFPFVSYFKSARVREQAELKLGQFLSNNLKCSINITLQLDPNTIIAVQDESQFLTIKEDFNNFSIFFFFSQNLNSDFKIVIFKNVN